MEVVGRAHCLLGKRKLGNMSKKQCTAEWSRTLREAGLGHGAVGPLMAVGGQEGRGWHKLSGGMS